MPVYKKRPAMSDDTPVWRYLSLDAAITTIQSRRLRLTRVDTFLDPFEGSVPKTQIDSQIPIFSGAVSARAMMRSVAAHYPGMQTPPEPDEDPWTRTTRFRRARTRSAHASCWSSGDESEALWRLYCAEDGSQEDGSQGVGVALRTTLARLEASVAIHDLYVSPITYRRYHEGDSFTDEMDSLLHKRHGFAAERELRLLKFDETQYRTLLPKEATVTELPEHVYLEWILSDVIDEIVISPYANVAYEHRVRNSVSSVDAGLAVRVQLSELHHRRYPPGF